MPGDFNPGAALPVWPLLEAIVFRFTGVSLVAARALTVAVFGCILVCSYLLSRRWSPNQTGSLAPEAGVALLVASPFCFVFTRLAILEPLLVLLTLLLLLAAGSVRVRPERALAAEIRANVWPIFALGLLLPMLVLTKTTGLFLVPAIAFLLLGSVGFRLKPFLRVGVPAAALGVALWMAYYNLAVRPRFLLDYRYLFSANAYTQITLATAATVLQKTFADGTWMGYGVYTCAVVCAIVAVTFWRRVRSSPLIGALLLWAVGYEAFLAYHNNLQPRYYLVVAVPLTLLIPATVEQLVWPILPTAGARRWMALAAAAGLTCVVAVQGRQTLSYIRHPEYTLLEAAQKVKDVIATHEKEDPKHSPLVLSISGSDLSLMTGMPSICDDFGTLELVDRVRQYRPGWYVAWNQIDDDKMDALTPFFHIERVAAFPAMDDPDRNLLIVYRLDDSVETAFRKRHGKPTPKGLRTGLGQQPSTSQLRH